MQNKKWWKSKTVWLAILQFAVGLIAIILSSYPEMGYLVMLKSILDISLRLLTDLPIE